MHMRRVILKMCFYLDEWEVSISLSTMQILCFQEDRLVSYSFTVALLKVSDFTLRELQSLLNNLILFLMNEISFQQQVSQALSSPLAI
jgi:hypothetical protein